MEFSVTGDQHVELTAMSLDESEGCLLTGLRDGTVKMWNHAAGECLLTFPNPDQMEVSLVPQLGPLTAPVTLRRTVFHASLKACAHGLPGFMPPLSLCVLLHKINEDMA